MSVENLVKKWEPVLDSESAAPITESYKKEVTAQLLENTAKSIEEGDQFSYGQLTEAAPANATGNIAKRDPVLIGMIRRAMPNLIAFDVMGVQPMTSPNGLIFSLRTNYWDQANNTAAGSPDFAEPDTDYTGAGTHATATGATGTVFTGNTGNVFTTGTGMATADAEALGTTGSPAIPEMAFSIHKTMVEAKSRALKAEYTSEMAQDLKAVHGLDAEKELADILTGEVLAEINREGVRTIFSSAVTGSAGTATPGTFDLNADANGRWSVEKFKGLMFHVETEANQIAKDTRRGKGNIVICSSDVASALQMAGVLDYTPALKNGLNVDDTGNTFAGILNGRYKVYIDPWAVGNYMVVGYKGSNKYDAGLFYCPYVPLQMVRAIGENSFQPKIAMKTRYGMVANPFSQGANLSDGTPAPNTNLYYRRSLISNLM